MPGADVLPLLERRLARLRQERPELEGALDLQARLIRESVAAAREPEVSTVALDRDGALGPVRAGVPLLHQQAVHVDVLYAADHFSRVVNALAERDDETVQTRLQPLVAAATSGLLDPFRLFREAFVQHREHVWEIAGGLDVDGDLLVALSALAVAPLLRSYAPQVEALLAQVDDGAPDGAQWRKGCCPACGAWPLLGEIRGLELQRFLRCSACGLGWQARRLVCPYCDNDDFRQQETLRAEGERRVVLEVCERCRGYLKVMNAFDPTPSPLLPLEDVATVLLDMAAIERGYRRPEGSGFVLEIAGVGEEVAVGA